MLQINTKIQQLNLQLEDHENKKEKLVDKLNESKGWSRVHEDEAKKFKNKVTELNGLLVLTKNESSKEKHEFIVSLARKTSEISDYCSQIFQFDKRWEAREAELETVKKDFESSLRQIEETVDASNVQCSAFKTVLEHEKRKTKELESEIERLKRKEQERKKMQLELVNKHIQEVESLKKKIEETSDRSVSQNTSTRL